VNKDIILEKLKTILKVYSEDPQVVEGLSETTSFVNDLKINSANIVDVFLDIEDTFEIEFSNRELESLAAVSDTINLIAEKVAQKTTS
jgi:acyl carrier protein